MSETATIGCLIGTAVGDALGLPYEGLSRQRAGRMLGRADRHRFLLGHGMISDDTEHSCLVARSLIRAAGDADLFEKNLAHGLRRWFLGIPAGMGMATARSCLKLLAGIPPSRSGVFSAGNGPAMRSAVLGVYAADLTTLRELVHRNSRITHTDPKAECGAVAIAVAAFLSRDGQRVEPERFLAILHEQLADDAAGEFLELIEKGVASADRGESTGEFARALGHERGVGGYVYHSVPVVLQCWLRHQNDFRGGVMSIIECGGDADTNAAMVGGIVGARVGIEGIPAEWIEGIREWPCSVTRMKSLGRQLSESRQTMEPGRAEDALFVVTLLRNVVFLVVVLFHGFRRLLPPY